MALIRAGAMYSVHGTGNRRVLVVPAAMAHRWRFVQVLDGQPAAIKFKRAGAKLLAVVSDKVLVYRKPHASTFHYVLMQANRGALSRGEPGANSDRILDNMLEYIEAI